MGKSMKEGNMLESIAFLKTKTFNGIRFREDESVLLMKKAHIMMRAFCFLLRLRETYASETGWRGLPILR